MRPAGATTRLFIAIDLPKEVHSAVADLQSALPRQPGDKINLGHDFHITLKFLGECDEAKKEKIEEKLAQISFESFKAVLEGVGVFGASEPRVCWVGVMVPGSLFDAVAQIENEMSKLGFEKEQRFTPHITLARMRFLKNPENFVEFVKKIIVPPLKFRVDRFYLFSSELSPEGARYTKFSEFQRSQPAEGV